MENHLKVLFVAADSGFYRITRYTLGDFFGPVDLGLHLAGKHNSLNIGAGLLGRIHPARFQSPDCQRILAMLGWILYFHNGRRRARL